MLSFQKLRVYQRSIEFLAIGKLGMTPRLALEIIGELQLLRAAQSQPRNIAEGAGRRTSVDQARFARGSAMEAAAALDTMRVMKLVGELVYAREIDLLEGIVAMLTKMTSRSTSKVAFMFRFKSMSTSTFLSDRHWI